MKWQLDFHGLHVARMLKPNSYLSRTGSLQIVHAGVDIDEDMMPQPTRVSVPVL